MNLLQPGGATGSLTPVTRLRGLARRTAAGLAARPRSRLRGGGTIGGLTMVSRILGFAREMIFARVMGATAAAEVFIWAFQLPNLLRRLLGEGAFSQGFGPLFARRIGKDGDLDDARRFAEEVQAVFLPTLIVITALFIVAMPAVVIAVASGRWTGGPERRGRE